MVIDQDLGHNVATGDIAFKQGKSLESLKFYGDAVQVSQKYTDWPNALIRELTSKEWELLPAKGPKWWNYKFRRQAKPKA